MYREQIKAASKTNLRSRISLKTLPWLLPEPPEK